MRTLLLVALLATSSVQAQPTYDFSAVGALLTDSIDVLGGGASLLIRVDGDVVFRSAFGAYAPGEIVPTASAAKWLSAGVIASLISDGTMTLDDSLAMFFPSLQGSKRQITMRQAFSHTSGMAGQGLCLNAGGSTLTACAGLLLLAPLDNEPGTAFSYGGVSMHVAARAAEIASGESWVDLFSRRIADPLGLTNTFYASETNPRVSGAMRTTVDDYGRFLQVVLDSGVYDGQQVLAPWAVDSMLADQTRGAPVLYSPYEQYIDRFPELPPLDSIRYGMGMWREHVGPDGSLRIGNSHGAFGASPWIDPTRDLAGVLLVQDELPNVIATFYEMRRLVEAAIDEGPVFAEPKPEGLLGLSLSMPSPNPSTGLATITLTVPASTRVQIEVVDVLGRVVLKALDSERSRGEHRVVLDVHGLAPGHYRVTARAAGSIATQTLVVLR